MAGGAAMAVGSAGRVAGAESETWLYCEGLEPYCEGEAPYCEAAALDWDEGGDALGAVEPPAGSLLVGK